MLGEKRRATRFREVARRILHGANHLLLLDATATVFGAAAADMKHIASYALMCSSALGKAEIEAEDRVRALRRGLRRGSRWRFEVEDRGEDRGEG